MKRALLTLSLGMLMNTVFGQFNQTGIENRIRPDSNAVGEVHFNFYNFNFVRNYEYSNAFHDGYTLYGTQLQPEFVYHAHPNLAITAGAVIRKDFGDNGVYDAKPLFSVKYQKRDLQLIFGSIEGGIHHIILSLFTISNVILPTRSNMGPSCWWKRKSLTWTPGSHGRK